MQALKNPSLSKEQRSKIRNRISAQKSRDRKKQEYGSLRFAIGQIQDENVSLKKQLKKKEQAMKKLQRQMRQQLCKRCKKIQFDFGDEASTEEDQEEDTVSTTPSTQQKGKPKSRSLTRNSGFTIMRRSAGSALTGGLFAAFIGIICMIGILMNSQSSGAGGGQGGAQKLISAFQQNTSSLEKIVFPTESQGLKELQKEPLNYQNKALQHLSKQSEQVLNTNSLAELLQNIGENQIQFGEKLMNTDNSYNATISNKISKEEILNIMQGNST